ncbi:LysR family transcriptional regulator [Mangrovibacter plantisponsor]|uniref:LysR family transcriptional regulator n=1 Tax=Mangrovibacter plantisponsor TaxID=451513 RepID=A0A317PR21_9ENTR|nr:LysR family transcriptional regulator [Mangrovibacter plantisponsor]PWW02998.1 LysR family transcriptional regulator [Mangrovibacter plantisponsor]
MTALNLDHLHTFCLVARYGSFSSAANLLGLSQPAVSQQIRQLEQWFATRLLERTARGMKPTPAGQVLLELSPQLEHIVADIQAQVANCSGIARGIVSLGMGATACIHLMPPVLQALRQSHPQLTVSIRTGNTQEIIRAVEENRLDAGLVTLPADSRNIALTPLCDDEFFAIGPYEEARDKVLSPLTPETLSQHPLIIFEPGSSTRKCIDGWFSEAGFGLQPVMELGSIEAIKSLVRAGMGYSIVPAMAITQPEPGITSQPLTPRLSRTLALALRQDKPLNHGMNALLSALKNAVLPVNPV